MNSRRTFGFLAALLFLAGGGCALPGYDKYPRGTPVEDRSRPVAAPSPYERPPAEPSPYERPQPDFPTTSGGVPAGSETVVEAPRTREGEQAMLNPAAAALVERARTQRDAGELTEAAATLERALRIAPRAPRVYRELAEVRLLQGRVPQAEQFARKGISLAAEADEEQARLWTIVAECRHAQNDPAGAAAAEEEARRLQRSWRWWK